MIQSVVRPTRYYNFSGTGGIWTTVVAGDLWLNEARLSRKVFIKLCYIMLVKSVSQMVGCIHFISLFDSRFFHCKAQMTTKANWQTQIYIYFGFARKHFYIPTMQHPKNAMISFHTSIIVFRVINIFHFFYQFTKNSQLYFK